MQDYLKQHLSIALHLLVFAVMLIASALFIDWNERQVKEELTRNIEGEVQNLYALAEMTDRNDADETIKNIIIDCPRRTEYDTLLNELGSLSKKDLVQAQVLSESCAGFYAERKALMVASLEKSFEHYTELVSLLSKMNGSAARTHHTLDWDSLVKLEIKRSELLTEQTRIQADIITKLISGSSQYSKEVQQLAKEAQNVNELLQVHDLQIDEIRAKLETYHVQETL